MRRAGLRVGERVAGGGRRGGGIGRGIQGMVVDTVLGRQQRDSLDPEHLSLGVAAQPGTLAGADRHAAPQIGQRKRRYAVTAVHGAEQREQRRVLRDRQQLALAQRPAARREVIGEQRDLAEEWLGHGRSLPVSFVRATAQFRAGKMPSTAMTNRIASRGWRFSCGWPPLFGAMDDPLSAVWLAASKGA